MTQALILLAATIAALLGIKRPYVWVLGYLWLDYFRPQQVSPADFYDTRLLSIFGVLGVAGALLGRQPVLRGNILPATLILAYAAWISLTTTWAAVPDSAQFKLGAALPAIVFSAFLLAAIRSERDLMTAFLAILLGASVHLLTAGINSLMTGGGYNYLLGIANDNFALAESSTMSVIAVAFMPLILLLRRFGWIPGSPRVSGAISASLIVILAAACIGSHARSGMISAAALFVIVLIYSRRRLAVIATATVLGAGMLVFVAEDSWTERMLTVKSYDSDTSSIGRLEIWKWTLDYVASNPLGGGFSVNETSVVSSPPTDALPNGFVKHGVGFHSLYFEVLGEHGWPGLFLYCSLISVTLMRLYRIARKSNATQRSLRYRDGAVLLLGLWFAFLSGSAFVAIAHMPYFFNFVALSAVYCQLSARADSTEPSGDHAG